MLSLACWSGKQLRIGCEPRAKHGGSGKIGIRFECCERRDVDDRTATAAGHDRHRQPGCPHSAEEIGLHSLMPVRVTQRGDRTARSMSGGVDQHVDPPPTRHRGVHQLPQIRFGSVGSGNTDAAQLRRQRLALARRRQHGHGVSVRRETPRRVGAHAASRRSEYRNPLGHRSLHCSWPHQPGPASRFTAARPAPKSASAIPGTLTTAAKQNCVAFLPQMRVGPGRLPVRSRERDLSPRTLPAS